MTYIKGYCYSDTEFVNEREYNHLRSNTPSYNCFLCSSRHYCLRGGYILCTP